MSNQEIFEAGIAAARAGDLTRATALFSKVVKTDPASELGWLWLGKCCIIVDQKKYCFRRVLKLNPLNMEAVHELEILARPIGATTPAGIPKPHAVSASGTSKAAQEPTPKVSAFVFDEDQELSGPSAIERNEPTSSSPLIQTKKSETGRSTPKQKKAHKFVALFGWIAFISFLVCVTGVGYLYLSGKAAEWLPVNSVPTWTSARLPTQATTQTPISTPLPTASPTLPLPTQTSRPTSKPTVVYAPVFDKVPCHFNQLEGVKVDCGYVSVPEDRTNEHSKTVQLAVAVFHSTNPDPAPDPIVFLQGGPGGEAVRLSANAYDILVKPFLPKRDYIAFDQRGTGLSVPALGCAELEGVYLEDIQGQIPASSRDLIYTNAFRSCHGSMTVGGINLNSYNSSTSSDDLNDIVTALGYKQVNLYGASYGTRLALVTMRNHPGIVRSAVLDSVVPVEAKLFDEDPIRYGSSLGAMFDGCAADPKCNQAYPDLETVFWDLVSQLDTTPVSVTARVPAGGYITEKIDGSYLVGVTLGLLKTTRLIASAPGVIYDIKAGDYSTFADVQSSLPYEFEGINIGLYISVMCHEQILATTPKDLQAAMDSQHDIGRYFRLPFFGDAKTLFNTCKVWGSTSPDIGENDAVISDIPALIIEGKFDPATPPIFGEQVAANLRNSFYMEFPNQGHTPSATDTSGCAFKSILAFINNPTQKLDMTCLSTISGVKFTVP